MVKSTILTLEIVAILKNTNEDEMPVAAEMNIEGRDLDYKYQLSPQQRTTYNDFINTICSILIHHGFKIVDQYQSNRSYSYYIQFVLKPYEGFEDMMLKLDVKFRLSDHQPNGIKVSNESESKSVIFKSFVVEGVEHKDIKQVILDIQQICNDLKVGDYSRLV